MASSGQHVVLHPAVCSSTVHGPATSSAAEDLQARMLRVVRRALQRGDRNCAFTQRILAEARHMEEIGAGFCEDNENEFADLVARRICDLVASGCLGSRPEGPHRSDTMEEGWAADPGADAGRRSHRQRLRAWASGSI
jgi:hypothetical protein